MQPSVELGGLEAKLTMQQRSSSLVSGQAFVSTVLAIASSIVLLRLYNMIRRRKAAAAGGKPLQPGYNVVGVGINFEQQSLPYKANPMERMSRLLETSRTLTVHQYEDVLTLNDIFVRGSKQTTDGKCLGRVNREAGTVEWLTYDQTLKRMKHFADGLLELGLQPKSCLGIYSGNCVEYVIAEYGSYRHSIVVVPIYDTLGTNVASYIANQTELTCITCDKADRIERIIEQAAQFSTLKHIILTSRGHISEQLRQKVAGAGFQLHSMTEVEQLGEQNPKVDYKPSPTDLAIICYTSGTTNLPKGAMLTHENVVASVSTISVHLMEQHLTKDDLMLSILPLAHTFQRIGEGHILSEGGKVAYYSGEIQHLSAEIQIARPTIILVVPRLLNRIHDAIYAKVQGSWLKKTLLRLAYQAKQRDLQRHVIQTDTIWDKLVFGKVRANFGGRLRMVCCGAAPLSGNVLDFLRCALGCVITEGYGQTECGGPCTATLMGDASTGHIGPPLVASLVKLIDLPDMDYYTAQGKGEILVKGPVVFQGYYKMPEETAKTLDADGWLHTGDIGEWTEQGTLRLIDRKKNIFKLSQGEYIAPEKIENTLISSRFVSQIYIHGESLKSKLVAIVVPEPEHIESQPDLKALGKEILEDLLQIGISFGLESFELPRNIYVHKELFTIEQGLITPTLKSKRNEIAKRFRKQLDALYWELDSAGK